MAEGEGEEEEGEVADGTENDYENINKLKIKLPLWWSLDVLTSRSPEI